MESKVSSELSLSMMDGTYCRTQDLPNWVESEEDAALVREAASFGALPIVFSSKKNCVNYLSDCRGSALSPSQTGKCCWFQ